jgi:hypothetical protein
MMKTNFFLAACEVLVRFKIKFAKQVSVQTTKTDVYRNLANVLYFQFNIRTGNQNLQSCVQATNVKILYIRSSLVGSTHP